MSIIRTTEYVISYITDLHYTPLLDNFIDSQTKFDVICPEGHIFDINWNNFQQGRRCPYCSRNKKKTDEEIKNKVNELGFELLNVIRKNRGVCLQIECNKGHSSYIQYGNLINRKKCPICSNEEKKIKKEQLLDFLYNKKYEWISGEYIDNCSLLQLKCENGHVFESYWRLLNDGYGCCPICNGNRSIGEKEVSDLVSSLYSGTIIFNDRTQIINPKTGYYLELDIYLPNLKKAIEYNSEWTHKNENTKYKDCEKIVQCKEMGIELMIIDDQNWHNDKIEQTNKIKMFMEA